MLDDYVESYNKIIIKTNVQYKIELKVDNILQTKTTGIQ